jgi:hypothetical protein
MQFELVFLVEIGDPPGNSAEHILRGSRFIITFEAERAAEFFPPIAVRSDCVEDRRFPSPRHPVQEKDIRAGCQADPLFNFCDYRGSGRIEADFLWVEPRAWGVRQLRENCMKICDLSIQR